MSETEDYSTPLAVPTFTQRLRRLLGSSVEHDLRPSAAPLEEVGALEPVLKEEHEQQWRDRAATLRARAAGGEPLDNLLPETFALVREVSRRLLGLRPYDMQLLGGIGLHRGRVVQMQTGEGKTLAAVAPAVLNALGGRGVHVLTVNDYLARRDAAWMGPVYESLGLTVGVVQEGMSITERREAYGCDVTYLTAREAGFDHLRGFLALAPGELVHRPFHFAIVDEADSILIDEARIPLVIAGGEESAARGLERLAGLARQFEQDREFETDEYERNISLSAEGARRAEAALECNNLYEEEQAELLAALTNALHAEHFLRRDVDYIVREGKVELVDEFTGRVAERRQWPHGLQAAIEAKEGLRRNPEGRILGSITMQHFLQRYPRLSGMTATASSSAEELKKVYGLEVLVVPTHHPLIRVDHPDKVFTHLEAKERALIDEIATVRAAGRPVLVGTASVAESERLAEKLREQGIACRVLNAKNDEEEAAVVAEAGAPGAVTISTNMAGRGTDIRLGGRDGAHRDEVTALGGLYVIGTNRHESLRVDMQLRGRAGRQGDPGSSRFFVSLEDELIERFGVKNLIPEKRRPERQDAPLASRVVNREIDRAQRIIDGQNVDTRRSLWKYAHVIETQRRYLQEWRQAVLTGEEAPDLLTERCHEKWERLAPHVGPDVLDDVERQLTLLVTDRCWSDYLAEMTRVRDGIHLASLGSKDPYTEFHREAREAFPQLLERIDAEIAATFEQVTVTADGVDWAAEGLLGPSSTWTYLVTDQPFKTGLFGAMAARPAAGIYAAAIFGPIMAVAVIYRAWRLRRRSKAGVHRKRT